MNTAQLRANAMGTAAPIPEVKPVTVADTSTTYVHQVAGANTILPDGRKLTFAGKTALVSQGRMAGLGYYTTDRSDEIEWLEHLVSIPASQITKLMKDDGTHSEKLVVKQVDPAIANAAVDAAKNSMRSMDPAISKVVDSLPNVMAANSSAQ